MGFSNKLSWVTLSLIGIIVIILSTRWGIGLSPDSISYIGGARSLAEGRGYSLMNVFLADAPITWHAPLYSALLSITGWFHSDPLDNARWVNAILFGANIFLICVLIEKNLPGKSQSTRLWLPAIGGWFVLTSPTLLEIHMMAWSEVLFLLLCFLGFYLLALYLENAELKNLIWAAILIALTMLTRYAGVVLGATGALAILLFLNRPWRSRITSATLFSVVSIIPLGMWLLHNRLVAGTTTARELQFHPIGKSQVSQAITTLASWLLIPDTARTWVKILPILAIALLLLVITVFMAKKRAEIPMFVKILGIFILVYFVFLAFSVTFVDAGTPLDGRILSPIYVSGLILVIVILGNIPLQYFGHNLARGFVVGVIALLAFGYLIRDKSQVVTAYQSGLGFNSVYWYQSETIGLVDALPPGVPIFSNAPEAIYFHSNRPAKRLPTKNLSANRGANPEYNSRLAEIEGILEEKQGVIVYFNTIQMGSIPKADELVQQLDLIPIRLASDGAIYGVR